eukprot:gene5834-1041_t
MPCPASVRRADQCAAAAVIAPRVLRQAGHAGVRVSARLPSARACFRRYRGDLVIAILLPRPYKLVRSLCALVGAAGCTQ